MSRHLGLASQCEMQKSNCNKEHRRKDVTSTAIFSVPCSSAFEKIGRLLEPGGRALFVYFLAATQPKSQLFPNYGEPRRTEQRTAKLGQTTLVDYATVPPQSRL